MLNKFARRYSKLVLSTILHPKLMMNFIDGTPKVTRMDIDAIDMARLAADWLLSAQKNAVDGEGYSRKFSLVTGWDRAYIETTGYIIPTLLDVSKLLGENKYETSAIQAADWLLSIQQADGAFTDIDKYIPHVFDTGQVVIGLSRVVRDYPCSKYMNALVSATTWLCKQQELNGAFINNSFGGIPHSYYSRVGATMIEAGIVSEEKNFIEAGSLHLDWVAKQKQQNGYYAHCEFSPNEDALLHTIAYVLEGFVSAFRLTKEERWLQLAIEGVKILKQHSSPIGIPYSQYSPDWQPTNLEYCTTGVAQYAGLCFDVAELTNDVDYYNIGLNIMQHLQRWQTTFGENIKGAHSGSIPIWGYYGCMEFLNWNSKFFLDAIIKMVRLKKFRKNG